MTDSQLLCEICLDSVACVQAAEAGGAHRVELCANLVEGGTTPSPGMVRLAMESTSLPIMVMVRPRGGDFCYSDLEFEVMKRDVDQWRKMGVHGVVFGLLKPDGRIDLSRTAELVELARPMEVTFHRAFDMCRDPHQGLEDLVIAGVDRVLTSGQEASVVEGAPLIRKLLAQAADRLVVMPGAGLEPENIRAVVEETGAKEVHFTAFRHFESPMAYRNPRCFMGAHHPPGEYERMVTDPRLVAEFLGALNGNGQAK
ncbi:MAG: copper homeostasis protein CutC [Planctomycetota bacterium]|nr:MAG: copper homeostasis protein CutC [Planctomycetota bacterium]